MLNRGLYRWISVCLILAGSYGTTFAQQTPTPRVVPRGTWDQEIMQAKITVSDLAKSYAFYTTTLGIGLKPACPQCVQMLDASAQKGSGEIPINFTGSFAETYFTLALRKDVKPTPESAALTTIMFKVKDLRSLVQHLKSIGYPIASDVSERVPGMLYAFIHDPDGYTLELLQAPKSHRSPGR